MNDYFGNLIDIMEKEVQFYRELKKIEETKKEVIINNDVRALEAITHKEQGFVKTIVQLETLRTQAVDGLCRDRGYEKIEALSALHRYINPLEKQQLEIQEKRLIDVIQDTKSINQLNEKLIKQSLDYIDFTLGIAQSLGLDDVGYGKGATEREVKASKGLFDAKV